MISVHTKIFFKNLIDINKDKDTIEKEEDFNNLLEWFNYFYKVW